MPSSPSGSLCRDLGVVETCNLTSDLSWICTNKMPRCLDLSFLSTVDLTVQMLTSNLCHVEWNIKEKSEMHHSYVNWDLKTDYYNTTSQKTYTVYI